MFKIVVPCMSTLRYTLTRARWSGLLACHSLNRAKRGKMGGGHHHHEPPVVEPPYAKLLANKSGLCPPDFHYARGEKLVYILLSNRLIGVGSVFVLSTSWRVHGCEIHAEVWYPHGGFYPDPKGWRTSLGLAFGWVFSRQIYSVDYARTKLHINIKLMFILQGGCRSLLCHVPVFDPARGKTRIYSKF